MKMGLNRDPSTQRPARRTGEVIMRPLAEENTVNLDRINSGYDVPNDFNVIIEIPMHAEPIKYEMEKTTGAMFVDRFMSTAMRYPCNYGYVPRTPCPATATRWTCWCCRRCR